MTASTNDAVEVVLFDIGGVVVEVNDFTKLLNGLGITDVQTFHDRWLMCPAVRRFESGESDVDTFVASAIEDLELDMTPDAFLDAFHQWPKGVFPGIKDLIRETAERVTVGCLSNTNTLHWTAFVPQIEPDDLFHHQFLSFEIGMMKPDMEIYDHAADTLGTAPGAILFLDDNGLNVDAARRAGYRAEIVQGVDAARAALEHHRVL